MVQKIVKKHHDAKHKDTIPKREDFLFHVTSSSQTWHGGASHILKMRDKSGAQSIFTLSKAFEFYRVSKSNLLRP